MDVLQVDRSDRKILLKRSTKYETQPYKWMEKSNNKMLNLDDKGRNCTETFPK